MLNLYWNNWIWLNEKIATAFKQRDSKVENLMELAVDNYTEMIGSFVNIVAHAIDDPSEVIEPLNGRERLDFIRGRLNREFAYIQLDALYTEANKKAVSLLARNMIKSR
ncbi:YpoC family protein [Sporosarcina highlanderae]|uniref:YpoC-like domain-containing protein n=1 Tax=Sporosarcina highlanderae TaxID=3035916 RepID=A0ABT8JU63_9BACL|nr:hypothetical protein [Sporosarcina highlanderae]MDN4608706.1 hypothetical protein [Sporosarcina highlanderae]